MIPVIVVRCANGVVVWERKANGIRTGSWVCTRDQFAVPAPETVANVESFLLLLAQHSQSLAGSIVQVVQLAV